MLKTLTVGANGTFTFKGPATLADPQGIVTNATVTGTVSSPTSVSGIITITQTQNGDTCGPAKMKFTATPGTPTSLGLNGGLTRSARPIHWLHRGAARFRTGSDPGGSSPKDPSQVPRLFCVFETRDLRCR